ncbi:hypothetical protein JCM14450A_22090 [Geobacillus stearothermophilus]
MNQRLPSWMSPNAAQNILKEGLRWNSQVTGTDGDGLAGSLPYGRCPRESPISKRLRRWENVQAL